MDLYLVVCDRCEMGAKARLDEPVANWIAEKHANDTGHTANVRATSTEDETVITCEDGGGRVGNVYDTVS